MADEKKTSAISGLLGKVGGAFVGGIGSSIGSGIGSAISGLFGPSYETQARRQREQYDAMSGIAYKWNEAAADNAAKRQQNFYDYTLRQESPAMQAKRLKEAGLSKGLMYSNAAGSVATAGSGAGGMQGGGGGNPTVDTPAAQTSALAVEKQANLSAMNMLADVKLKNAQAKNIDEDTEKISKETESIGKDIEIKSFEAQIKETGAYIAKETKFMEIGLKRQNLNTEVLKNAWDAMTKYGVDHYSEDQQLAVLGKNTNSLEYKELQKSIDKIIEEIAYTKKQEDMIEFTQDMQEKELQLNMLQLAAQIQRNEIEEARVGIEKFVADYQTGEKWNWKTIADIATGLGKLSASVVMKGKLK